MELLLWWPLIGFGAYVFVGYLSLMIFRMFAPDEFRSVLESRDRSLFSAVFWSWPLFMCLAIWDGLSFLFKKAKIKVKPIDVGKKFLCIVFFVGKKNKERKEDLIRGDWR